MILDVFIDIIKLVLKHYYSKYGRKIFSIETETEKSKGTFTFKAGNEKQRKKELLRNQKQQIHGKIYFDYDKENDNEARISSPPKIKVRVAKDVRRNIQTSEKVVDYNKQRPTIANEGSNEGENKESTRVLDDSKEIENVTVIISNTENENTQETRASNIRDVSVKLNKDNK